MESVPHATQGLNYQVDLDRDLLFVEDCPQDAHVTDRGNDSDKQYMTRIESDVAYIRKYVGRDVESVDTNEFQRTADGYTFAYQGETITEDEVEDLFRKNRVTPDNPVTAIVKLRNKPYEDYLGNNLNPEEPARYSSAVDTVTSSGERVPELDNFQDDVAHESDLVVMADALRYLYDDLGIRYDENVTVSRSLDEQDYERGVNAGIDRGTMICQELTSAYRYMMQDSGIPNKSRNVTWWRDEGFLVGHQQPVITLNGDEHVVDPTVYMEARDDGVAHRAAVDQAFDPDERFYTMDTQLPEHVIEGDGIWSSDQFWFRQW